MLPDCFGTSTSVSTKNSETGKNTQGNEQQAKKWTKKNEKEENGQTINMFEPEIKMGSFTGLV